MGKRLIILLSLPPVLRPESIVAELGVIYPEADIRNGPWIDEEAEDQTMPVELMKGADVLFCEVPPSNFEDFDQLKWIQLTSAGYSQVLDLPVLERDICVTNARGVFDVSMAEWNIMMILMWHRNMTEVMLNQQAKVWDQAAKYQYEVRGSIVGLYGYGGMARETARIAKAVGLAVWALTRDGSIKRRQHVYCVVGVGDPEGVLPDRVFAPEHKEVFFAGVDYLVVGLPLTPSTEGIIGEEELRMLKPSAVLINSARARIIEEQAYIECLQEGWIRGSSLDVHYAYPLPPEHPLWSMPNLIMTPHISGSNAGRPFVEREYDLFTENLRRYCVGEPLLNELTEAQLRGE